jgi:hypothetical protein
MVAIVVDSLRARSRIIEVLDRSDTLAHDLVTANDS